MLPTENPQSSLSRGPELDTLLTRLKKIDPSQYTLEHLEERRRQARAEEVIAQNAFANRYLKLGPHEEFVAYSVVDTDEGVKVTFTSSSLKGILRFQVWDDKPEFISAGSDTEDDDAAVFLYAGGVHDDFLHHVATLVHEDHAQQLPDSSTHESSDEDAPSNETDTPA